MKKNTMILSLSVAAILVNLANADEIKKLDTVTVTAQKQEENVQKIPMSVSVFNEFAIEDKSIKSVSEIADFTPNLMLFEHGGRGITSATIRGISAPFESLDSAVGLFVDGVPILSAWGFDDGLLDIERIEILRGPQGTLYGKGTEAGAINIITRKPDNETRGKISLGIGEDNKRELSVSLSGPIKKDKLFLGISASHYQKDGFIKHAITGDMVNDQKYLYGKANFRWTPTDELDISLIISRLKYDGYAGNVNLGKLGSMMFGVPAPNDREVLSNAKEKQNSINTAYSLRAVYDISSELTFTSISTNWISEQDFLADMDKLPITMIHTQNNNEYKTISQEFRLNYSKDRLKWLAGLYFDKADNKIDILTISPPRSRDKSIEGDTYALFSSLTYPLSKKLSLVAGLRYEKEKQEFKDDLRSFKTDESWDSFTPKVALNYQYTPHIMTYISASKGYRSGGFNWMATNPIFYSYNQEELWSYEIGVKSELFHNRLILNGAIYYMDISNMQVVEHISAVESYTTNAAEASSQGFELEAIASITDTISLEAGFGYNDTKFDKFSDIKGDHTGNYNPYAPKYNFNIGTQYRSSAGYYARVDLIGYGKMYLDKTNRFSRDAYEIVNTKIGYELDDINIYLYGKNILNKKYDADGYFGGFYTVYSEPREIGLKIDYRF